MQRGAVEKLREVLGHSFRHGHRALQPPQAALFSDKDRGLIAVDLGLVALIRVVSVLSDGSDFIGSSRFETV
jgi:hypothetical protein